MRMNRLLAVLVVSLTSAVAFADAPPRVLVLPLPASNAVDASTARTFDARLLVALDDSRRVVTVTPEDEPQCTTMKCLAELGVAENAAYVLSLSVVREGEGLTLFGTLIDSKTGVSARRIQVARLSATSLAKLAPGEVVPQLVGAPAGQTVLAIAQPASADGQQIAHGLFERLSAFRTFKVLPLDGSDRSPITHRAELALTDFSVTKQRHQLCTWLDGNLTGTFTITEVATGRVVFTKPLQIAEARRFHFSSREEVTEILVTRAVDEAMAAMKSARVDALLAPPKKK
jgi:hypothetical protein